MEWDVVAWWERDHGMFGASREGKVESSGLRQGKELNRGLVNKHSAQTGRGDNLLMTDG